MIETYLSIIKKYTHMLYHYYKSNTRKVIWHPPDLEMTPPE